MNGQSLSARICSFLQIGLALGLAFDASAMDFERAATPKSVCKRTHADALTYLKATPQRFNFDSGNDPQSFFETDAEKQTMREDLASGAYFADVLSDGVFADGTPAFRFTLEPRFLIRNPNPAGDWDIGLCWWHSRMQRAAAYLVEFVPTARKANQAEAKVIFKKLSQFQPVMLPGYESFAMFSLDFHDELVAELSRWQKRTTFEEPGIVFGASAKNIFTSQKQLYQESSHRLDGLLNDMETQPRPIFILLPSSAGIHSFLVTGFQASRDGTVRLQYLDSNYPGIPHSWRIRSAGVMNLKHPLLEMEDSFYSFHTQFEKDFDAIEAGLRTKCGQNYRIRTR